jgi:hypothetical protein
MLQGSNDAGVMLETVSEKEVERGAIFTLVDILNARQVRLSI